ARGGSVVARPERGASAGATGTTAPGPSRSGAAAARSPDHGRRYAAAGRAPRSPSSGPQWVLRNRGGYRPPSWVTSDDRGIAGLSRWAGPDVPSSELHRPGTHELFDFGDQRRRRADTNLRADIQPHAEPMRRIAGFDFERNLPIAAVAGKDLPERFERTPVRRLPQVD